MIRRLLLNFLAKDNVAKPLQSLLMLQSVICFVQNQL